MCSAVRTACENVIARFGRGKRTVTLYRPVGPKELDLIAAQIARDWNVKASGAGFVTKFDVDAYCVSRYRIEKVGGAIAGINASAKVCPRGC
jgi:hypothetical protein